jgi:hypothetical protein
MASASPWAEAALAVLMVIGTGLAIWSRVRPASSKGVRARFIQLIALLVILPLVGILALEGKLSGETGGIAARRRHRLHAERHRKGRTIAAQGRWRKFQVIGGRCIRPPTTSHPLHRDCFSALQNGPRRQGSTSSRKASAPLPAPGRSADST